MTQPTDTVEAARILRTGKCCYVLPTVPTVHIPCDRVASWAILSEGAGPYDETHACDLHLADLLEAGLSRVWPLREASR